MNLQALFNLTGNLTGQSDPVSITVNPLLTVQSNTVTSAGLTTAGTTNQSIIPTSQGDTYLFVHNTGTNGLGTGTGNILVTNDGGGTILTKLGVNDFAFFIVEDGTGAKIKYDTADTNVVYAFFTKTP
jgi:hypothetical protein